MTLPLCPFCHAALTYTPQTQAGGIYECGACRKAWPAKTFATPLRRHAQRGKRRTQAEYEASASEAQIQACIVQGLRLLGFVVVETGKWRADTAGNTLGCPDLFCIHRSQPNGRWFALELKTVQGVLRTEQAALVAARVSEVARSWEDALKIVEKGTSE